MDFTLPTHAAKAINQRNEDIAWGKLELDGQRQGPALRQGL